MNDLLPSRAVWAASKGICFDSMIICPSCRGLENSQVCRQCRGFGMIIIASSAATITTESLALRALEEIAKDSLSTFRPVASSAGEPERGADPTTLDTAPQPKRGDYFTPVHWSAFSGNLVKR